jgi:hypothetical protein
VLDGHPSSLEDSRNLIRRDSGENACLNERGEKDLRGVDFGEHETIAILRVRDSALNFIDRKTFPPLLLARTPRMSDVRSQPQLSRSSKER